jgi:hypothetical protein
VSLSSSQNLGLQSERPVSRCAGGRTGQGRLQYNRLSELSRLCLNQRPTSSRAVTSLSYAFRRALCTTNNFFSIDSERPLWLLRPSSSRRARYALPTTRPSPTRSTQRPTSPNLISSPLFSISSPCISRPWG